MSKDGSDLEVLINFGAGEDDTAAPRSIGFGDDGIICGVASGIGDAGEVFRVDPNRDSKTWRDRE